MIQKEEYFELHKSIKNFDKVIFVPLHTDFLTKLNTFVTNQSTDKEATNTTKIKI